MTVTAVQRDIDALSLIFTVDLDATPARAWELWADPRQLERWWGPPGVPGHVRRPRPDPGGPMLLLHDRARRRAAPGMVAHPDRRRARVPRVRERLLHRGRLPRHRDARHDRAGHARRAPRRGDPARPGRPGTRRGPRWNASSRWGWRRACRRPSVRSTASWPAPDRSGLRYRPPPSGRPARGRPRVRCWPGDDGTGQHGTAERHRSPRGVQRRGHGGDHHPHGLLHPDPERTYGDRPAGLDPPPARLRTQLRDGRHLLEQPPSPPARHGAHRRNGDVVQPAPPLLAVPVPDRDRLGRPLPEAHVARTGLRRRGPRRRPRLLGARPPDHPGRRLRLRRGRSIGSDAKGYLSLVMYAAGIGLAFVPPSCPTGSTPRWPSSGSSPTVA